MASPAVLDPTPVPPPPRQGVNHDYRCHVYDQSECTAGRTRRAKSGLAGLLAGLLGLACLADSRPARAELYTGLDAAFTMDALWGAGRSSRLLATP